MNVHKGFNTKFDIFGVYIFVFLCAIMLPACKNNSKSSDVSDMFIQINAPSSLHATILEEITPIINASIKQELGLDAGYDFEFFIPKQRQVVTVYYLRDLQNDGIEQILTSLDQADKTTWRSLENQGIVLIPTVEFFAGPFGESDELVMMIRDQKVKLSALRTELKDILHAVNDRYNDTHTQNLYDVTKSEQYPYVPHMGLGRIRAKSIKEHGKAKISLATIQERIKRDIMPVVERLCANINSELYIKALNVFDLPTKKILREYLLSSERN